jgi:hypothetical protein
MRAQFDYFVVGALFVLPFALSASACAGSDVKGGPPRRQIEDLLLQGDAFPEGWTASSDGPHAPSGDAPLGGGPAPIEATILFFHIPVDGGSGGAFEEIFRFWTEGDAANAFVHTESKYFHDDREAWTVPPGLADWRPAAVTSRLGCTDTTSIPLCQFLAQYGEYLVGFSIDTSAYTADMRLVEIVTEDRFLSLVEKIDGVMVTVADER